MFDIYVKTLMSAHYLYLSCLISTLSVYCRCHDMHRDYVMITVHTIAIYTYTHVSYNIVSCYVSYFSLSKFLCTCTYSSCTISSFFAVCRLYISFCICVYLYLCLTVYVCVCVLIRTSWETVSRGHLTNQILWLL